MADGDDAAVEILPLQRGRRGRAGRRRRWEIRGLQGILVEEVLDVGQDQLLMLLLVVEAEEDQLPQVGGEIVTIEQSEHAVIDVVAIVEHVGQRGRVSRPRRGRGSLADGVVVGIEKDAETAVEAGEGATHGARG